jgi:photosystem II stability/assembly factor-like uncharacterized protein
LAYGFAAAVLGVLSCGISVHAAAGDPAPFSGMHWRNIGPYRAGRSVAVAGVPGQPNVFYFGAVDGGVWKTVDAGWQWKPIFDGEPVASIGAIAVAPSDPNIVYVGTGEADPRSQVSYGDGMYKSTDAGKTWTHIGLDKSVHIGTVIVDPRDPNRVFVAVLGNFYAANPERGVYRSLDGGQTWQKVLWKGADVGAIGLAFDPDNAQIVYATLWATRRPPWSVYPPSNGPGAGIYESTDGGTTWKPLKQGLPTQGVGKIGIAVAPSDPNRVYAIVDAKKGGLYRSDDAGATWKLMDSEARIWGRGWYFDRVTVDPKNENRLYVMNTSTYRSTDGGQSFEAIKGAPGGDDYHELWVNPGDPDRMVLSSDQGTIVSVDGARSWSSWNNQPTGQYYGVSIDNQRPFWVHGPMQDSGGHSAASDVLSGRVTYQYWEHTCTGGESNDVAADPLSDSELYGLGFAGGPTKCDMLTGTSQSISPLLAYPGEVFRHDWTTPVAFSSANKHAFYFANQYLWQTTDGGATWEKISPDLSREHPGIPRTLDPTTAADTTYDQRTAGPRWGVIYTIAPSPMQADTLWTGTDDGLIWVTHDDGKHWSDVTPKSVTPWSKVIMVDASHFDANVAYAAIDRHRLNDYTPHLLRTRDGGKTWREVDDGLPPDAYVQAVKQDPGRRGMLWAGTTVGVYVSFDEGDHWQSLRLNMPLVEIRDFAFHGNSVAIATFGRSLWVLDDLDPLRQMNASIADSPAYLYKPEPAMLQVAGRGFDRGSGLAAATDMDPIEVWSGEPGMKGAIIDYYLKSEARGPIALDILDGAGKVVRHYSSDTKFPQADAQKMDVPAVWRATPAPLLATAGMHRFAWDLREASSGGPAPTGPAARFGGSGHAALPGQYTVRLTVDGATYSQPMAVSVPSGVQYDQADLEAQVQLLARIQALQSKVETAEHQAEKVHKELDALRAHARGSVATSIETAQRKVRSIEGHAVPPDPDTSGEGGAAPAYDSLEGLDATLSTLSMSAQQGGMGPPKQALITGLDKTEKTAGAALAAWAHLEARDLEQLDAQLRKAHLQGIEP